jgi:hypothetical protein
MSGGAAPSHPIAPSRGDLPPDCYGTESLYNLVVKRIRACNTLFQANVKLVLRQLPEDHWANLPLPYCLVVPTFTQPTVREPPYADLDTFVNPRRVTLIAQLDGRGSEAEWMAADDIELAEKQLIGCLVNWRPIKHYRPTIYAGMRLMGARIPDVKVSFSFVFYEEIAVADSSIGLDGDGMDELLVLGDILVTAHVSPCDDLEDAA